MTIVLLLTTLAKMHWPLWVWLLAVVLDGWMITEGGE